MSTILNILKLLFYNLDVIYNLVNIICPVFTILIMIFGLFYTKDYIIKEIKDNLNQLNNQSKIIDLKLKYLSLNTRNSFLLKEIISLNAKHILEDWEKESLEVKEKSYTDNNHKIDKISDELDKLGSPIFKTYKTIEDLKEWLEKK